MKREEEYALWMRQGIDGDEVAYRRLLESLGAGLRVTVRQRFLQAGMGNSDIEDVVQETLLALHLKRHTWKRAERIGPWIVAITRNKLVDVVRRRKPHLHVPFDEIEATLFEQPGEAAESREDVETMLKHLDERQRTIVKLVSIEGQSCRQAGDALRMTEVAVRVALHRALKVLAAMYRGASS